MLLLDTRKLVLFSFLLVKEITAEKRIASSSASLRTHFSSSKIQKAVKGKYQSQCLFLLQILSVFGKEYQMVQLIPLPIGRDPDCLACPPRKWPAT